MHLKSSSALLPVLVAWSLLSGAALAQSAEEGTEEVPLHPMELSYSASMEKGISLNGSARRILEQREDGTWRFRTDVDSFIADIDETLIFRWENNQVVPLSYRYKLSGFLIRNREEAINFDWDKMVVSGHHEGDRFSMELEEGAMDPMGYQLQLSQDIKAGKREMEYRVIDKGDYDTDRFAVVDEETLSANGEEIRTLKAEKVRDSGSKRQSLMWFAPERDHLLIRFLQVEPDGSEYELTINEATVTR